MGYIKAEEILPVEVLELVQQYVDGKSIYIPRKAENRREWGESTLTRKELEIRNQKIYQDYLLGMKNQELAEKYFLSEKSIQRITKKMQQESAQETL